MFSLYTPPHELHMRDLSLCLWIAPLASGACIKSDATTHFLWLPCFCVSFASAVYKHIFKHFYGDLRMRSLFSVWQTWVLSSTWHGVWSENEWKEVSRVTCIWWILENFGVFFFFPTNFLMCAFVPRQPKPSKCFHLQSESWRYRCRWHEQQLQREDVNQCFL